MGILIIRWRIHPIWMGSNFCSRSLKHVSKWLRWDSSRLPHRFCLWISDQIFHNVCPIFSVPVFCPQKAWMSLILRVRGPTKPRRFFCLYSAFRTAFSDWDEIDFGVPFFFSCQTQSLSPRFPSGSGEKREQRGFLIALLSSTSARHIHQLVFPSSEKGLESTAAGFYFIILGHRGDSLVGRATSGKGMVMEDKGMRQGDWCLCVHVWSCVCVCVCVCLWERGSYMCVSWGEDDWRGPQSLWGVCDWEGNGELGLGEYDVEVEEGEKDELEDGRAERR